VAGDAGSIPGAPSNEPATVLDLYKLAVEQADRISGRRASANSYFLTIHTGLAALTGLLASMGKAKGGGELKVDDLAVLATAVVGLLLSGTWWLLLRSYRDLNSAKFKVITEIEAGFLPLRIFQREWEILRADEALPWWGGRYAELGFVERVVPAVFAVVYLALGARVVFT
jgi:hypothetical protein